ncbi:MAG TPA: DUF3604 domain-containing protein, partial [Victivallales bacterium]|nr:DUF3604 domain-containing protein [Victivallales bacterium]
MTEKKYNIYWGDTHHNTYTFVEAPSFDYIVNFASGYLDFYTGAYYTPTHDWAQSINPFTKEKYPHVKYSLALEIEKTQEQIETEWKEVEEVTSKYNKAGEFVVFPGYEWQGSGSWGDLNVVYKSEGEKVYVPGTVKELYDKLKELKTDAIAIPHHTGYYPGIRAPYWKLCDENVSPFSEIFSVHGCSETDEEHPGLRMNSHMGPGTGGGTYQSALNEGLRLGAICSTDNWTNMPGRWGHGLMACLSETLTRESVWDAFKARRVYGVTGDRIKLDFRCNGEIMGSILEYASDRELKIDVSGCDALDRIEILKNDKVFRTYSHQGTWLKPEKGELSKFKIRLEMGWGPKSTDMPEPIHEWNGSVKLSEGEILKWEPSWINNRQSIPHIGKNKAEFNMASEQRYTAEHYQGGILFEFESVPEAVVEIEVNGEKLVKTVKELMDSSNILWYKEEVLNIIKKHTGIKPEELPREDPLIYHYSYKVKVHKVIPEAGYSAIIALSDISDLEKETYYRVRVEQRNGQKAWSS